MGQPTVAQDPWSRPRRGGRADEGAHRTTPGHHALGCRHGGWPVRHTPQPPDDVAVAPENEPVLVTGTVVLDSERSVSSRARRGRLNLSGGAGRRDATARRCVTSPRGCGVMGRRRRRSSMCTTGMSMRCSLLCSSTRVTPPARRARRAEMPKAENRRLRRFRGDERHERSPRLTARAARQGPDRAGHRRSRGWDGPYLKDPANAVGGSFVIEAADIDEAVAIAARVPAARLGVAVEIRPA